MRLKKAVSVPSTTATTSILKKHLPYKNKPKCNNSPYRSDRNDILVAHLCHSHPKPLHLQHIPRPKPPDIVRCVKAMGGTRIELPDLRHDELGF